MKRIPIILLCLLIVAVVAGPVFACGKTSGGGSYFARNSHNHHEIARKSNNAGHGLSKAAQKSNGVEQVGKVIKD